MSRRQAEITSRIYSEKPIKRGHSNFKDGMINDMDPTKIPDTAVWDADNWIVFQDRCETRSGTMRLSSTLLPTIATTIAASKSASTITISSGYTVSSSDIGRYFIHDSGDNELITGVNVGANSITVTSSSVQSPSTNGRIRDRVHAACWHPIQKRFIIQIGQRLFYAPWDISAWTQIYSLSPSTILSATISQLKVYDNDALLFNDGGLFKVEISAVIPVYYVVNYPRNTQTIVSIDYTTARPYGRRYLYTNSVLNGNTLLGRINGNSIVHESSPNSIDANGRDYAAIYKTKAFGPGTSTYAVLTGGVINSARDSADEWEVINNGQATFSANGISANIAVDFSGCQTMADVAARLEIALRAYWPTCTFVFSNRRFVWTLPDAGSSVSYCTAGGSGTDISGSTCLNMAGGGGVISSPLFDSPNQIAFSSYSQITADATSIARMSSVLLSFQNSIWLIGGYDTGGPKNDVWRSFDGINWTQVTNSAAFPSRYYHAGVVYDNRMWIFGGYNDISFLSDVWFSSDGITWTQANSNAWPARGGHGACVYNDRMWVVAGDSLSSTPGVYYSQDGIAWEIATNSPEFGYRSFFGITVYNNKMWVIAGGDQVGNATKTVYNSSDGIVWTLVTGDPQWSSRRWLSALVFDGLLLITGAYNNNETWVTTDGVSWSLPPFSGAAYSARIAPATATHNGRFFLVGGYANGATPISDVWELSQSSYIQLNKSTTDSVDTFGLTPTHYSIYGTKDIGPNGTDPTTGIGNNPELYVLLDDVPIAKAFNVTYSQNGLVAISGQFSPYDVGSYVYIEDGTVHVISSYVSPTFVKTTGTSVTNKAASIGTRLSFVASQSGNTVTISSPVAGVFTANDLGKRIFWADGTTSIITARSSATVVTVADSTTRSSVAGAIVESATVSSPINCRGYYDIIDDATLSTRISSYPLKNRLWSPMPNCNIGVVAPGFVLAAIRDQRNVYYTQLSDKYLVGSYSSLYQFDTVEDSIRDLRTYPVGVSAICSHSVTTWDVEVVATKEIPQIGELIVVIAQKRVVDSKIGCHAFGSICSIETGLDVMLTSDAEVRTFDGSKFGGNIASQRIMKLLRRLQPVVTSSYDLYGGYLIWGTESTLSTVNGQPVLPFPDKCYRFALTSEQGVGCSRVTGAAWIRPEEGVGGIGIFDANGNARQVILDNASGIFYWISTRNGPAGSGLTMTFVDKDNGAGNGTEIASALWLKSHTGATEQQFLQHLESRLFIRPYSVANRGATGYDAAGFRTATSISLSAYKDGAVAAPYADTKLISNAGEIVFQGNPNDEGNQIQLKVATDKSEVVIVGTLHAYMAKDKASGPGTRATTEGANQTAIANLAMWFSRGKLLYQDRVTQATVAGTPTPATGPDGRQRSAFTLGSAKDFLAITLTGGAVMLWRTAAITLTIGASTIVLTDYATVNGWTLSYALNVTASGVAMIAPSGSASIFDFRALSATIAVADIAYYYTDVVNNGGANVCPRW